MKRVKVIDAICGSGKSTHAINTMKSEPHKKWLYVTPYLSEAGDGDKVKGRIRDSLPELDFACPSSSQGRNKSSDLTRLLLDGRNVAMTHNLLMLINKETLKVIRDNEYHVIIDETLDVISIYNGIHKDDVKSIVGTFVTKEESTGKLSWDYTRFDDNYKGHFKDIKDMCDMDCLYLHKDQVLINKLSPCMIEAFSSTTILTYMFEGSFMCSWLKLAGIEFEYQPLNSGFDPRLIKQGVRDNLVIMKTPRGIDQFNYNDRGQYLKTSFSSSWYKFNKDKLEEIKKGCEATLTRLRKQKIKHQVFWTTFKPYKDTLKGAGYTRGTIITEDGERLEPFITKNKRASNEHADCNMCLYLVNVFAHGDISTYMEGQGMQLDNEKLALSEMVQFIFRGSIRKGEKMYIMLASKRMEDLLLDWLDSDE